MGLEVNFLCWLFVVLLSLYFLTSSPFYHFSKSFLFTSAFLFLSSFFSWGEGKQFELTENRGVHAVGPRLRRSSSKLPDEKHSEALHDIDTQLICNIVIAVSEVAKEEIV